MRLNIGAVQAALKDEGLDGWLLYDFHGSNPVASRLAGLSGGSKLSTRRWYYLIPAEGEPRGLVHAIESHNLDELPGEKRTYAGRQELEVRLRELVSGHARVAMEYSPRCAIPYVSRVDAGTIEWIRELGVEVRSSGDLIQRFEAVWDEAQLASHLQASEKLYQIKDRTFDTIRRRMLEGSATTEFEIQQLMVSWFREAGLVTDSPPIVAAQENASNPHYGPTADTHRAIHRDEVVLLDLWGKLTSARSVFADITWVGFTGTKVPDECATVFAAARDGRDAAIGLVKDGVRNGQDIRGWQVDRAARTVIDGAGYGRYFLHRTGHSLGEEVHGNGAHMDDYETHDDRRLLQGSGFTIEPGIYLDRFGVRTEINMYVDRGEAVVSGPVQTEIVALL